MRRWASMTLMSTLLLAAALPSKAFWYPFKKTPACETVDAFLQVLEMNKPEALKKSKVINKGCISKSLAKSNVFYNSLKLRFGAVGVAVVKNYAKYALNPHQVGEEVMTEVPEFDAILDPRVLHDFIGVMVSEPHQWEKVLKESLKDDAIERFEDVRAWEEGLPLNNHEAESQEPEEEERTEDDEAEARDLAEIEEEVDPLEEKVSAHHAASSGDKASPRKRRQVFDDDGYAS